MVCHTMKIVNFLLKEVNPGQVSIISISQPVYAIGKQMQWHYPNLYGVDKFVMMMGLLHFEINCTELLVIGLKAVIG